MNQAFSVLPMSQVCFPFRKAILLCWLLLTFLPRSVDTGHSSLVCTLLFTPNYNLSHLLWVMPISLWNTGQQIYQNPGNYRSLTWLRNTRLLVPGAVFMLKSIGSVQGFSTPVGLQLGWLEWCGARGLSMSYFTQVHREITELTSLLNSISLSHSLSCTNCQAFLLTLSLSLSSLPPILSISVSLSLANCCLSISLFLALSLTLSFPRFLFMLFFKLTDLNKLPGLAWIIDYGVDF